MHTIEVSHDLTLEIHPGSDGGRPVLKLHSRDAEIARGSQRSDRTCREGVINKWNNGHIGETLTPRGWPTRW